MREIAEQHAPAVLANSLAYEDMVITDVIARLKLPIHIFTLQTGMLHAETSNMVAVIKSHYDLDVIFPSVVYTFGFFAYRPKRRFFVLSRMRNSRQSRIVLDNMENRWKIR